MYKEPGPMREIHGIQERLYEEEKGLSSKELIAKIHEEAEELIREYGLKFKRYTLSEESLLEVTRSK